MKIAIIHLSDIHMKEDSGRNPILARTEAIGACVRAKLEEDSAHAAIFCISGDIAATGLAEEYVHARKMFGQIEKEVSNSNLTFDIHWLTAPGNHDCDFRKDTAVRRRLLGHNESGLFSDSTIINECTHIQKSYFDFARNLNHWQGMKQRRLFDHHQIEVHGFSLTFYLINTAWVSQIHEKQGELWFPRELIAPKSEGKDALSVAIFHHPYNWMTEVNGKAVRRKIEELTDVVLTGHEHDGELSKRSNAQGGHFTYLEGDVLQDTHHPNSSSFYYASFDLSNRAHYIDRCRWEPDKKLYVPKRYFSDFFQINPRRTKDDLKLLSSFSKRLEDPGAGLVHPRCENLSLSDIYVYPDFSELSFDRSEDGTTLIRGEQIVDWVERHKRVLITGGDRSGKSALAKRLFSVFYQRGFSPLLVSGRNFKKELKPVDRLRRVFGEQYGNNNYEKYNQLPNKCKILIVDDYEELGNHIGSRNDFVSQVEHMFSIVLLFGPQELRLGEMMMPSAAPELLKLKHCSIMELGYLKRSEIVQKWHNLGVLDGSFAEDRAKITMKIEKTVSEVLGQDLVPSYPIFVLIFLQQLEAGTRVDASAGSFAYLYSSLVFSSLSKITTKMSDIDIFENILSELARHMYLAREPQLAHEEYYEWGKSFNTEYALDLDHRRLLTSFVECGIILLSDGVLQFRYRYLYYYFVAKSLSNSLAVDETKAEVGKLATKLYVEEYANIMLFLCFFSKDQIVIDKILGFARSLFPDCLPCDLGDRKLLSEIFSDPPTRNLEVSTNPNDTKIARNRISEAKDQSDLYRRTERLEKSQADLALCQQEDEEEALDFAMKFNVAYKTIQILGQALRNHPGSLRANRKKEITKECYSLGLRAMSFFFGVLKNDKSEFIGQMGEFLEARHGEMLESERRDLAKKVLFGIVEFFSYSVIRYISESVGSEELGQTYKSVSSELTTASSKLIDLSIKLDNKPTFPEKDVTKLSRSFRNQFLPFAVLQRLVWFHFYIFQEKRAVRQRVCDKLGLKFSTQQKKELGG